MPAKDHVTHTYDFKFKHRFEFLSSVTNGIKILSSDDGTD